MKKYLNAEKLRSLGIYIILILVIIVVGTLNSAFLSKNNILNIGSQISMNGILSVGMTIVIISGGFDLSVGSNTAMCGAVALIVSNSTGSVLLGLLGALVVGLLFGTCNGLIIKKIGINALITTLATNIAMKGIALIYTHSDSIMSTNDLFKAIGKMKILDIPFNLLLFVICVIVGQIFMSKTKPGRYIYALGGNERAARLSGIKTDLYGIIAFAISGFCCALVGIMMTTKLGSVSATYASGYEMDAIAATVIGGTSINGGEGSVGRTVAGILLLGVLSNAFDLMGIGIEYQYVFKGVVILLAVSADKISDFTKSKKVSFQK